MLFEREREREVPRYTTGDKPGHFSSNTAVPLLPGLLRQSLAITLRRRPKRGVHEASSSGEKVWLNFIAVARGSHPLVQGRGEKQANLYSVGECSPFSRQTAGSQEWAIATANASF